MSDSDRDSPLPEAGNDAGDPNRPISEERDTATAPDLDMDDKDDEDDLSENESELSEVDEAEFAEFDPTTVALEDRPVEIDEDIARTLKAGKRKRADKDGEVKKPKEAKREKKKRQRRDDDEDPDGEVLDGKRVKKSKTSKSDGERKKDRVAEKRPPTPENDENLTPEERRRRALDKAMDAALKNPNKRRRKKDEVVCIAPGIAPN
jgi:transcription factor SPN1